jgi:TrmH family RNA methyltransferase
MRITSTKNEKIKATKQLLQKKYREKSKSYLIEGFHLIEEAVKSKAVLKEIFATESAVVNLSENLRSMAQVVSDEVMSSLTESKTPQGVVAVVAIPSIEGGDFRGKWVLLDNVQDPGNVGTIIRNADAFGCQGVVLGKGSVDLYQPKLVRAMQGSHFHIQVIQGDLEEVIPKFKENNIKVLATALNNRSQKLASLPSMSDFAVVMGNEGSGVSEPVQELADEIVFIEMFGQAESLNVGVASGITLYQLTKR